MSATNAGSSLASNANSRTSSANSAYIVTIVMNATPRALSRTARIVRLCLGANASLVNSARLRVADRRVLALRCVALGPMSGAPAVACEGSAPNKLERRRFTMSQSAVEPSPGVPSVPSVPSVPCVPSVERRRRGRREPPEMCSAPEPEEDISGFGRSEAFGEARRRGVVVSSPTTASKATTGDPSGRVPGVRAARARAGRSSFAGGEGRAPGSAGGSSYERRGSEVRAPTRDSKYPPGPDHRAPVRFRDEAGSETRAARSEARGGGGGASREGRVGGIPRGGCASARERGGGAGGSARGVSAANARGPESATATSDLPPGERSPGRRGGRGDRASPEAARGARGVRARGARAAFRRGGIARGGRGRDDVWRPKGAPRSATRPRNAHEPTTRFSCHHFFVVPRDSSFPVPLGRATVQDSSGEDHKRSIRS